MVFLIFGRLLSVVGLGMSGSGPTGRVLRANPPGRLPRVDKASALRFGFGA